MSHRQKWTISVAGIIIVLSVAAIQQAGLAPHFAFEHLGSGTVPYFVAISLLVLSALMLAEEFLLKGNGVPPTAADTSPEPKDSPVPRLTVGLRTGVVFIGFLVFVLVLDYTPVPFWLATLVFTYLASRVLEGGTGRARLASIIIAAVVAVGIHVVFTEFLLIDLP